MASWSPTGRDAIAGFPADRGWDLERLYDPDPDQPGHDATRATAASSHDAGDFDAGFFGITPARGAGHGPAAAAAAGDRVGGARARRHRPGRRCAAADTGVFAGVDRPGLRRAAPRRRRRLEGYLLTGSAGQRRRPAGSPTRSAWRARRSPSTPRARRRWSRCTWPCQALRAGRVLAGAGRRRDRDGRRPALFVEFSRQRGLAAGRPLQGVRGAAPTAPAGPRASACCCWSGCPTRGATATGCSPWSAARAVNQDGASQRPDRAERPVAAAGDPAGAGQRRAGAGRRRRGRGARHRHHAGRPDRGAGAAGHLRPGPRRTARCGSARSSRTSATPRPPPASPA